MYRKRLDIFDNDRTLNEDGDDPTQNDSSAANRRSTTSGKVFRAAFVQNHFSR